LLKSGYGIGLTKLTNGVLLATLLVLQGLSASVTHAATNPEAGLIPDTAALGGQVSAQEEVVAAQVYAKNLDKNMLYTVYTNKGHYRTVNMMPGAYEVWAEKGRLRSDHSWVRLEAGSTMSIDFTLKPGPDFPLTLKSRQAADVKQVTYDEMYPPGQGRDIAERTCMSCHGQLHLPSYKMNKQGWDAMIGLMLDPGARRGAMIQPGSGVGTVTPEEREVLAVYLAENFGLDSANRVLSADVEYPLDEEVLSKGMFVEYLLPLAPSTDLSVRSVPEPGKHRMLEPHIDNSGHVWATNGYIGVSRLDPQTAEWKHYPFGIDEVNGTPYIMAHGMTIDSDENVFWIEFRGKHVGRLNTKTGKMDRFPIDPAGEVYNIQGHTPDLDSKENVWFTVITGNKMGVWDRKTEKISLFEIPTPNSFPYGIDVDQNDNVYFAELFGCKVGVINADTKEFKEYPALASPCSMNRLMVDKEGIVWYSVVRSGILGRLDPETGAQKEYDILPFRTDDKKVVMSGPYGIIADKDNKVWFGDHGLGGALIKFDPDTETFLYHPLPRQADNPNIDITGDGAVVYTTRSSRQAAIGVFYPDVSKMTTFATYR
jgi:virginiamycin B lyase